MSTANRSSGRNVSSGRSTSSAGRSRAGAAGRQTGAGRQNAGRSSSYRSSYRSRSGRNRRRRKPEPDYRLIAAIGVVLILIIAAAVFGLSQENRQAVDASAALAANLFSPHCNFYCPYYRQITMESWMTDPEETERRYAAAYDDIEKAFDYYMTHLNEGRPFMLAGHSQGAKTVVELLKHKLSQEQQGRMVAAYVFGFPILGEELEQYPALRTARDSVDTGVIISFNSVAFPAAASPLFAGNTVCINPLNWSTDTAYAPASRNLGSVFFNGETSDTLRQQAGARIDLAIHSLIVDGLNPEDYYIPSISTLFPKGNYHVQEINLYFLNVQKNIGQRVRSYFGSK